ACTNNVCGTAFTAAGTATTSTPAQTPGDCEQVVCDGNGGTQTVVDTNNFPTATSCDTFGCAADAGVTDTFQPNTTKCGTSSGGSSEFCNGMGLCGCQSQSDCPAASCNGTVVTFAQSCTSLVCVAPAPATHDCAPYLCSGRACTTMCTADNQCAAGA